MLQRWFEQRCRLYEGRALPIELLEQNFLHKSSLNFKYLWSFAPYNTAVSLQDSRTICFIQSCSEGSCIYYSSKMDPPTGLEPATIPFEAGRSCPVELRRGELAPGEGIEPVSVGFGDRCATVTLPW